MGAFLYRTREITKEQYENATIRHDAKGIFTDSEVMGYGVYGEKFYEKERGGGLY